MWHFDRSSEEHRSWFINLIPNRLYCSNDLSMGVVLRPRSVGAEMVYLQPNSPWALSWLLFDIDRRDASICLRDAGLPEPTFLVINPDNLHAHALYKLATPVAIHDAARSAPIRYAAAIQTAMARRMGADLGYSGLLVKNPLHTRWRLEPREQRPYSLSDLQSWLSDDDMRFSKSHWRDTGIGRNVTLFDNLRAWSYMSILKFKSGGGNQDSWFNDVFCKAIDLNNTFSEPLFIGEVRATAKSVSKWTYRNFTPERFRLIQAARGRMRALKLRERAIADGTYQPWVAQGISRATYFRRKSNSKSK